MKLYKLLIVSFVIGATSIYFNEKSQNHFHGVMADINAQDEHGQTALFKAVGDNRIEDVIMLMNNGADLEIADNEQCTPLHNAIKFGNIRSAALLIAHGAQGQLKNKIGKTPLEYAKVVENEELVSLLEAIA